MKLFEITLEMLAENEKDAQYMRGRLLRLLTSEKAIVTVSSPEDFTHEVTTEEEIPETDLSLIRARRDVYFINQLNREQ
jgi:hypothetical protein